MINYREMPYVRRLAEQVALDAKISVPEALARIDAIAYSDVVELWNYYFNDAL